MRIAIVGVGLIGGSVGMAARERLGATVSGWSRSAATLTRAVELGAIDRAGASLADAVADAEAVFVAAPVGVLPAVIAEVLAAAPADCVVTDVGSTKRSVVDRRRGSTLRRRPPARGRGDDRRRARPRGSVPGRHLVPDADARRDGHAV